MTKVIYSLTDFVKVFSHSYTVKAQASGNVRSFYAPPPPGILWILTFQSSVSWVSELFRQDIGQFHSMKPCKSADYFLKVSIHAVDMEQGESKRFSRFQLESFFFITKNLTNFRFQWKQTVFQISMVETGVNPRLQFHIGQHRPE